MLIDNKTHIMRAALMLVLLSFLSVSCSATARENPGGDKKSKKTEQTFIFHSGENQDKYEAVFSDGKLVSLSKNGKHLSKEEMKENEDIVYQNLGDLRRHDDGDNEDFVFHFNGKEFSEHMKHFGDKMKHFGEGFPDMME